MIHQCPWCYSPAIYAVWTPRHGWHDVCARHHDELAREVRSNLIESRTKSGTHKEV